jgi:hypothetical protein
MEGVKVLRQYSALIDTCSSGTFVQTISVSFY